MEMLQSFKDYITSASTVRPSHLVKTELPDGSFVGATDYFRDIVYEGITYTAGSVKSIGSVKQTKTFNTYSLSIKLSGALDSELQRALNSSYYMNRSITVYKAYLDDAGSIIPMLLDGSLAKYFAGIVTKADISESTSIDGKGTSTITWTCNSEFSDFDKVNGRITSDTSHRGLISVDGQTDLQPSSSAKRVEYQTDLGFLHANRSVSTLAKYQVPEKRYTTKIKKNWYGGIKSIKTIEYTVMVEKEVDLRYDLTAQYLPVIYGVRNTVGIPIFTDTLVSNPSEVYMVLAFCEGEIEGFLDFYLDGNPIICWDAIEDPAIRVCWGSKKTAGNTIAGISSPSRHGITYTVNDGDGNIEFTTYHGKGDQTASSIMTQLAETNSFYLQNNPTDPSIPTGAAYWDARFKLLDTAYVVCKITLNTERTTVPAITADILGKKVNIYNSDNNLISSNKTTTNPIWQMLDYITNPIYGGAADISRVSKSSFYTAATLCDIIDTSYEATWVSYWRYLGWNPPESFYDPETGQWGETTQDYERKILQCNVALATELSIFKNIDSMLQQIDASLNISAGIQTITISADTDPIVHITDGDTSLSSVDISDNTQSSKYNSLSAAIIDPGKQWGSNTITFYDPAYKLEDNNIEKKGNYKFPYITNYYTARSAAERFLRASRSSRSISITLPFMFSFLQVNDHFTYSSDRFSWDNKRFIVSDAEWLSNGRVKITASEYVVGMFINSSQTDITNTHIPSVGENILPISDLSFAPQVTGGTEVGKTGDLSWLPSTTAGLSHYLIKRTGSTEGTVLLIDSSKKLTDRIEFPFYNLDPGAYTFGVKAVDYTGRSSKEQTLVVNITASVVLHNITGLTITNKSSIGTGWVGSNVLIVWDSFMPPAGITNCRYNLQILDANPPYTVLRDLNIALNTPNYSYTLIYNKADYLVTKGTVGVYRDILIKIKAVADNFATSQDWSTL